MCSIFGIIGQTCVWEVIVFYYTKIFCLMVTFSLLFLTGFVNLSSVLAYSDHEILKGE